MQIIEDVTVQCYQLSGQLYVEVNKVVRNIGFVRPVSTSYPSTSYNTQNVSDVDEINCNLNRGERIYLNPKELIAGNLEIEISQATSARQTYMMPIIDNKQKSFNNETQNPV